MKSTKELSTPTMFACIYFEKDASLSVLNEKDRDLIVKNEFSAKEQVEMLWREKPGKPKQAFIGTIVKVGDNEEQLLTFANSLHTKFVKGKVKAGQPLPEVCFSWNASQNEALTKKRDRTVPTKFKESLEQQEDELSPKKKKKTNKECDPQSDAHHQKTQEKKKVKSPSENLSQEKSRKEKKTISKSKCQEKSSLTIGKEMLDIFKQFFPQMAQTEAPESVQEKPADKQISQPKADNSETNLAKDNKETNQLPLQQTVQTQPNDSDWAQHQQQRECPEEYPKASEKSVQQHQPLDTGSLYSRQSIPGQQILTYQPLLHQTIHTKPNNSDSAQHQHQRECTEVSSKTSEENVHQPVDAMQIEENDQERAGQLQQQVKPIDSKQPVQIQQEMSRASLDSSPKHTWTACREAYELLYKQHPTELIEKTAQQPATVPASVLRTLQGLCDPEFLLFVKNLSDHLQNDRQCDHPCFQSPQDVLEETDNSSSFVDLINKPLTSTPVKQAISEYGQGFSSPEPCSSAISKKLNTSVSFQAEGPVLPSNKCCKPVDSKPKSEKHLRRSPRKKHAALNTKPDEPKVMVKLLETSDIKIEKEGKLNALRNARKSKNHGKEAYALMYSLLDKVFTLEELATSRGQGLGRKNQAPNDSRMILDPERMHVLKEYVTLWHKSNYPDRKNEHLDLNRAEVLRLGHKTCLYYPLYPPYTDREVVEKHSLVCSLKEMVAVRHRRQIVYPKEKLGINAPSDRVLTEREPYALNHINRKLTLEPKVTVNARIVVVGASDVGIGFLEALAYCPHLHFNNLTIISPHGLPGEMAKDEQRELMLSSSNCYSHEEYAKVALNAWVNVVYGKMTAIDRKKKLVTVNNSNAVPYDHLVLCTGQQYQLPMPTDANIDAGATNGTVPNKPDRRFSGEKPKNLFTINDAYESAVALYWIENKLVKSSRKTIVYGSSLDAYCCIQTLLSMGMAGDKIVFIQPPSTYETSCFNNPFIEEAMASEFESKGIKIYKDFLVAQWNDGTDCTEIKWVTFTSNDHPLRLECCAFFSYFRTAVDYEAFRAINDACLVYDGKLVIDAYFHTNDASIRGAGPLTKFQRKYHAEKWTHSNFNSKEVGVHLATEMLRLFDPTLDQQSSLNEEDLNLIPIYRNPKIQSALLPGSDLQLQSRQKEGQRIIGGYHYLHVAKPGLDKPLIEQMGQLDYGRELTTGHPGGEKDYFRLHLNQYNNVETITCLSKKPIASSNLVCLFGIHERCLNNLVSRFDEGLIKDLYEFFNETWSLAVYHDRFADFREELRELLTTRPTDGSDSLEERVRQLVDPEMPLSVSQREELVDIYKKSGAKRAVEARLLNYLSYNYYHLPMYAKPGMV